MMRHVQSEGECFEGIGGNANLIVILKNLKIHMDLQLFNSPQISEFFLSRWIEKKI